MIVWVFISKHLLTSPCTEARECLCVSLIRDLAIWPDLVNRMLADMILKGGDFHSFLLVFLAALRIKLTQERVTGDNQVYYVCTYGGESPIRIGAQKQIGQLRLIGHYELIRKGVHSCLGLQSGGRQFTWRWKSKRFINKCLLDHL